MREKLYTIEEFQTGKIPIAELENENNEIVLYNTTLSSKTTIIISTNNKYKCLFTLRSAGHYKIIDNTKIKIDHDNITIIAHNNSEIIDESIYNNISISLYDKSICRSSNNSDNVRSNYIYAYGESIVYNKHSSYTVFFYNKSIGVLIGTQGYIHIHDHSKVKAHLIYRALGVSTTSPSIHIHENGELFGTMADASIIISNDNNGKLSMTGRGMVYANGNSNTTIRGEIVLHSHSPGASINIYESCRIIYYSSNDYNSEKLKINGPNVQIIKKYDYKVLIDDWIKYYGTNKGLHNIDPVNEVILYKMVSNEYKTQERSCNETDWFPGTTVEMPMENWTPRDEECGKGKFHACGNPLDCVDFRLSHRFNDRVVAIKVNKKDVYMWSSEHRSVEYPNKITFRKGIVLYECDITGEQIKE